jgi:hypothetical protein
MGDRLDAGRFQVIDHAVRLIGAVGAVVVHDDVGAVGCQRFCEQFAEVGRSAGNDGDLARLAAGHDIPP